LHLVHHTRAVIGGEQLEPPLHSPEPIREDRIDDPGKATGGANVTTASAVTSGRLTRVVPPSGGYAGTPTTTDTSERRLRPRLVGAGVPMYPRAGAIQWIDVRSARPPT